MINRILHLCSCISKFIKLVGKVNKMLGTASHLIFSQNYLINSIIDEHSCKILFFISQLVFTSLSSSTSPHVLEIGRPEDRDEEDKEREENITAAIKYINSDISGKLKGLDPTKQREADSVVRLVENWIKCVVF